MSRGCSWSHNTHATTHAHTHIAAFLILQTLRHSIAHSPKYICHYTAYAYDYTLQLCRIYTWHYASIHSDAEQPRHCSFDRKCANIHYKLFRAHTYITVHGSDLVLNIIVCHFVALVHAYFFQHACIVLHRHHTHKEHATLLSLLTTYEIQRLELQFSYKL